MRRASSLPILTLPVGLVFACSASTTIAPPPATPENRLAPWTLEAEGAPPVSLGILDRTEGVHCTFAQAADGRLRCLPLPRLVTTGIFVHPSCTEQLFADTGVSIHARAGRLALPPVACEPERFEVRTLQQPADDLPTFLLVEGGACAPAGALGAVTTALTRSSLYRIGAIVPPERWVVGEVVDGQRISDRLRLRDVAGPGATRFPDHLEDDHWNRRCEIPWSWDSCWPASLEDTNDFADEACTQPVFAPAPCESPAFIKGSDEGAFFALGPRWAGPVFRRTKGCFPLGTAAADNLPFTKGAPLGPDAVAPAPLRPAGTGRVQAYALHDTAGTAIAPPLAQAEQRWRDALAGEDCALVPTPTAGFRCVALSVGRAYDVGLFADAACTQPAFLCTGVCAGDVVVENALRTNVQFLGDAVAFTKTSDGCVPAQSAPNLVTGGTEESWEKYPLVPERNGVPDQH